MKKTIFFLAPVLLVSCLGTSDAPNRFIEKEAGIWNIERWEQTTFTGGSEVSSNTVDNPGKVVLDVVNFGFYSEGTFEMGTAVPSPILSLISPDNNCYQTYLWNCDKDRMNFVIGWCDFKSVFTLKIDGWGNRKQTWTWVQTDANNTITLREVWELKRD